MSVTYTISDGQKAHWHRVAGKWCGWSSGRESQSSWVQGHGFGTKSSEMLWNHRWPNPPGGSSDLLTLICKLKAEFFELFRGCMARSNLVVGLWIDSSCMRPASLSEKACPQLAHPGHQAKKLPSVSLAQAPSLNEPEGVLSTHCVTEATGPVEKN